MQKPDLYRLLHCAPVVPEPDLKLDETTQLIIVLGPKLTGTIFYLPMSI